MVEWMLRVALMAVVLSATSCLDPPARSEPSYATSPPPGTPRELVFGVHPLHNPRRLEVVFGPLVDELARATGRPFRLEASRSYASFEDKLARRAFDFALPNPYQTVQQREHGYHVLAKQGDDARFRGLLIARKADGPRALADVKGHTVSFPAPTALAAAMMPQLFLAQRAGLKPDRDYTALYVGSQESSLMSVLRGEVVLGVTWPPPWDAFRREHPAEADQLEVRWETPALINNSVVARDDVPAELIHQVRDALVARSSTEAGRAVLARLDVSTFEPADDATYAPVERLMEAYAQEVGPLP